VTRRGGGIAPRRGVAGNGRRAWERPPYRRRLCRLHRLGTCATREGTWAAGALGRFGTEVPKQRGVGGGGAGGGAIDRCSGLLLIAVQSVSRPGRCFLDTRVPPR